MPSRVGSLTATDTIAGLRATGIVIAWPSEQDIAGRETDLKRVIFNVRRLALV